MCNETQVSVPIPFYSQRVASEGYHRDGFESPEDALIWQERGCGIACLRMVVDGFRTARHEFLGPNYADLVRRGLETHAYCERGWVHAGLVRLAHELGIEGKSFQRSTSAKLARELSADRPCIASVTVCFDRGPAMSRPRGGHLVVVLGFTGEEKSPNGFIVNHPSSVVEYNWPQRTIPISVFDACFSGAFMSFWDRGK